MINKNFEYRVDWRNFITGEDSCDFMDEESARWDAQQDIFNEIYSITRILDDEGNESENLLEFFRNTY